MTRPGIVCTPLYSEWAALWGTTRAPIARTGRGPAHRLGEAAAGPIAVAGVAGALDPDLRPGDLVVASEIRRADASLPSRAAPLLYGALRRLGLPARIGPIFSAERIVDGADRPRLARTGALAVDTESGFLADTAPDGQTAVIRAIVDTPDAPLLRAGTAWRGVRALRALRTAAPVLDQWSAAAGEREVLLASPRVFCAGVERAVDIVEQVARESDLVLVLGSQNSSNSMRLAEVAAAEGVRAHLVDDAGAVELSWLPGARRIGVTAGASAPPALVDDLVAALSGLGPVRVRPTTEIDENVRFNLPREVS